MSLITQKRIKQIRPKTDNGFETSIPLGVDGLLVDMLSSFDLEEQLKMGSNHYVEVQQTITSTIIKQYYFSQPKKLRTIEEMDTLGFITNTVYICIDHAVQTKLGPVKDVDDFVTWKNPREAGHPEGQDSRSYDQNDPTTFGDFIVTRQQLDSSIMVIKISLHKGNFIQPALHSKTIFIYESSDGGFSRTVVDEQVDDVASENPFNQLNEEQEEEP